jgi:hypothetical protein
VISAAKSIMSWMERGLRMGTDISYAMTRRQEGVLKKCGGCGQVILEKGIPVPGGRRDRWSILSQMEIGDSLITTTLQDFEKVRAAMRYRGMEYRSRKEPNGTGYRVWRIG